MDGQTAHTYAQELQWRANSEPGWDYWGHEEVPEWYARALSAVTLLTAGEQPVYVSGWRDEKSDTGTLHLFFPRSVITIEAREGADGSDRETVTERSRSELRALEVHVSEPTSDKPHRRDRWPGKIRATARYADGPPIDLPVSRTNDSRMSKELREFLPSLRADLDPGAARP